jgi:hypothetical protein
MERESRSAPFPQSMAIGTEFQNRCSTDASSVSLSESPLKLVTLGIFATAVLIAAVVALPAAALSPGEAGHPSDHCHHRNREG